jgi:AAA+ ATPase superfamily predicted ATPase
MIFYYIWRVIKICMDGIIGRKSEIEILEDALKSGKSELIAVYGRRRVGKTFLIREVYKEHVRFEVTGIFNGTMNVELANFTKEISKRSPGRSRKTAPKNWQDAFTMLELYLDKLKGKEKKVIFIDEFPWLATPKSRFLDFFGNFWNSYATKRRDLIVVVCGSSASYMVKEIIRNRGGLHNRITQKIRLLPFSLHETELFLKSRNLKFTQYDILQLYMAMGGIPHYLEKLKRGASVAQNIDRLCFEKDGALNDEFNLLFGSLFDHPEPHMDIIKVLAKSRKGITRNLLISKCRISSGGHFTKLIGELTEAGFVTQQTSFGKKTKEALYRLSDEYSLFYLNFISQNKSGGKGTWQTLYSSPSYVTWCGFSFETLCMKHHQQIKKALGIQSIYSINSSWSNENAQADLVLDRADNIINICELKFSTTPFSISKSYYKNLRNKMDELRAETGTRKNIFLTLVTTFGVKPNSYSREIMESEILMESLFSS